MKMDRIINTELIKAIAAIGHTQYMIICDAGLPIPTGIEVIDLSVVRGIPTFLDVVKAVSQELVIESYIYAEEITEKNPKLLDEIKSHFSSLPNATVSHERFKEMCTDASFIVRTGECTPYANIMLIAGVNF